MDGGPVPIWKMETGRGGSSSVLAGPANALAARRPRAWEVQRIKLGNVASIRRLQKGGSAFMALAVC
jgi:hypothetical protein